MPEEIELAPEEITDWQNNPVTKEFFSRLQVLKQDYDVMVHLHLAKHEAAEAADYNAAWDAVKEILGLPQKMLNELKEEKNENS